MAQKPGIPKGTRDFAPEVVAKRNYIFNTIKKQFKLFGFQPIETPSFENYQTLIGKYGEEGDRLIFKILNSGGYLKKVPLEFLENKQEKVLTPIISDKALRYDLTVPFARYVVQHQNEIVFPFKRFQIQPVWRADRPQRGRFREFYQCDADVVGSDSLFQEIEFVQLYDSVFTALKFNAVTIKINNRKILSGIAEIIGASDKLVDFTVALDKLDKIGEQKVKEEMLNKGIPEKNLDKLQPLFNLSGNFDSKIERLKTILCTSEEGLKGIQELEFINQAIKRLGLETAKLQLEVTLARGLNYYTGAIFEVSAPKGVAMGSIGGGGRYDNLTGVFGLKNMSGVGISFGLDRIFLVLEELGLFPKTISKTTQILFVNFGKEEALYSSKALKELRNKGINAELYPDSVKMKKQINYANKRQIPFVIIVGEKEFKNNNYTLKKMTSGEQITLSLDQILNYRYSID